MALRYLRGPRIMELLCRSLLLFLIYLFTHQNAVIASFLADECFKEAEADGSTYDPTSPLVLCCMLPEQFMDCQDPLDLDGNETAREELGFGCTKWGGEKYEDMQTTAVNCTALPGIECYGNRTFMREDTMATISQRRSFIRSCWVFLAWTDSVLATLELQ
ncbi:PREDICTED: TM2 domain-containing protein 2-like isoform X2 [Priapulus caudatus]|uniref:TM2 domain-containing protein 2-like isoform X2 n=1 Tax=Priapulus caudatus TaxID=37621 RepID=A0ABM1E5W8_PRICU|nr:PREDICTED: TM2 domain-containing protein 2-like isoform X2 [Priapulus caudatus]